MPPCRSVPESRRRSLRRRWRRDRSAHAAARGCASRSSARHRRDEVGGRPPGISAAGRLHSRSVERRDLIWKRMPMLERVGDDVERPLTRCRSDSAARIDRDSFAPFPQLLAALQMVQAAAPEAPPACARRFEAGREPNRSTHRRRRRPAGSKSAGATQSSCAEISAARRCDRAPVPADVPPPARPSWRGCTATCRASQRRSPMAA